MEPREARERADRLRAIATEMDVIVREIGPKMIRLAHLREEARGIMGELGDAKTPVA